MFVRKVVLMMAVAAAVSSCSSTTTPPPTPRLTSDAVSEQLQQDSGRWPAELADCYSQVVVKSSVSDEFVSEYARTRGKVLDRFYTDAYAAQPIRAPKGFSSSDAKILLGNTFAAQAGACTRPVAPLVCDDEPDLKLPPCATLNETDAEDDTGAMGFGR